MQNNQMIGLGVRLFSIWLFVSTMQHLPSLWHFAAEQDQTGIPLLVIVITVPALIIVALLWFFPLTIANKLLPGPATKIQSSLPAEEILRVGFCLMGLWLLTEAIPGLFFYAVMAIGNSKLPWATTLNPQELGNITYRVTELAIGVWLLFGAKGLLNILRWARYAARK